jgi:drug/metabolite transporter (DMT)-like permease
VSRPLGCRAETRQPASGVARSVTCVTAPPRDPAPSIPPPADDTAHDAATGSRRATVLPLAAAGVTILLWASAFVGIRDAGAYLSPGALSLGRLVVGSLVLGVFVLARREAWPSRRDLGPIVACGLLWFGAYNVALNAGEQRVDAGTAAMLVNVGPILIALMAGAFLGEGFPRRLLVGSGLGFAGVVVIGLATARGAGADVWGVALCGVAAVTYAGAVILQKPVLARVSALQVTWLACTVGALVCLPFAPALVDELDRGPASALGWVVYLGAFPTALAFTTWAYALARTSAGRQGATTYLVPAVAIVLAWALLGETPPALALVGGVVCLTGVAVTRTRPRRSRPPRTGVSA